MRLIDSHAHLNEVPRVEEELDRAKQAGLVAVIAVGQDENSNEATLKIARRHDGFVFPALGLHPWNLREDVNDMLNFLEKNINGCIALGEVGLDFKYPKPRELQIKAFEGVLDLAARHEKPVIVHSRWAWKEAFEIVKDKGVDRAVFHWYSGPVETLREILSFGCYVSATPAVGYSGPHRLAIRETPLGRLLIETDSPVKYRGIDSRPADVVKTMKAVASLKGVDEAKIAETTTKNAIELFGLEL